MQSQTAQPSSAPSGRGMGSRILASLPRLAQLLIVLAAVLVGIAIILDSGLGRVLNGLGAVAWVGAAILLLWTLKGEPRAGLLMAVSATTAVLLAVLVRPSDLVGAVVGFGIAAAVVAALAVRQQVSWALLVPALYLPAHLIVAISRSIAAGGTTVRTDPPPTAPVVPLVMVLVAAIVGLAAIWVRSRRD